MLDVSEELTWNFICSIKHFRNNSIQIEFVLVLPCFALFCFLLSLSRNSKLSKRLGLKVEIF